MSTYQQFKFTEFERLLNRIVTNNLPNCKTETILILQSLLSINYPYKDDDIEYIMDMINYYIRISEYNGKKSRFPVAKYLDCICKGELYLTAFINKNNP